jgi:hypothetical protein
LIVVSLSFVRAPSLSLFPFIRHVPSCRIDNAVR